MPDDRKRPSEKINERISALPDEPPPKRAAPPTYPGRLGFGKVLVPPKAPAPLSAPVHELTKPGSPAPPAPGSVAPYRRSVSPPPAELAADPQSARSERLRVRMTLAEREAEEQQRERRQEKSTLDSLTEIPGIRRGLSAFWRWVLPLLLGALTTIGGWLWGYAKGLAAAYERVAAIEQRAKTMSERVAKIEASVEELANAQAAEARSNRAERATARQRHEELVEKLELAIPKIQGLPPKK